MRLATARYFDKDLIAASGLAPIGTTVGPPRFSPGYTVEATLAMLAPHGIFGKETPEREFRVQYRRRLRSFGTDRIVNALEAICAAHGHDGAVLLCFCKLEEPGAFCHRRMFAEWWREQTGDDVPELAGIQLTLGKEKR